MLQTNITVSVYMYIYMGTEFIYITEIYKIQFLISI
jgi:hypothetical protein